MPRITVGTDPIQVAPRNDRRFSLSVEYVSDSVIATNNAKVYLKFGSPPVASDTSNTWDEVLNPGAIAGTNQSGTQKKAPLTQECWVVSSASGQILNVNERLVVEEGNGSPSGAAAS